MIAFLACGHTDELKAVRFWKYSDGFYLGDIIDFRQKELVLRNDTIYQKNIAVGIVKKIEKRLGDKVLHISDPKTGKSGTYVSK